ncbi:MAG: hypothetical protein ACOH2Q_07115 [Rhodococcus sp. (in: high G+C Gram-positive bacteria)]
MRAAHDIALEQVREVLAQKVVNLLEDTGEPEATQYFRSRGSWPTSVLSRPEVSSRATGPLLDECLSGEYDEYFGVPTTSGECFALDNAPVVLVDDGLAIVTAPVTRRHVGMVGAVSPLLVQAEDRDGRGSRRR